MKDTEVTNGTLSEINRLNVGGKLPEVQAEMFGIPSGSTGFIRSQNGAKTDEITPGTTSL